MWTVFGVLVLAVALAIMFQIVVTVAIILKHYTAGVSPRDLSAKMQETLTIPRVTLLFLALGQLGFAGSAWIYLSQNKQPWRDRIAWRPPRPGFSVYPIAIFATAIPTGLGLYLGQILEGILPHDPSFVAFFENLTVPISIPFVILIGLLPGFFEEIVFRGIAQQRFVQRWGVFAGILVTSITFAVAHLMPLNMVVVFPIGAWLCYIAWKANSIWPTIACHIAINSGVNLYRVVVKFAELPDWAQKATIITTLVIGAICFCRCLQSSYWANSDDETVAKGKLDDLGSET